MRVRRSAPVHDRTNGRGMLHLHALVWLTSNLAFSSLRERLLQDQSFASRMIHYLETIIVQSIDVDVDDRTTIEPETMPPSSRNPETDDEFYARLCVDLPSFDSRNFRNLYL